MVKLSPKMRSGAIPPPPHPQQPSPPSFDHYPLKVIDMNEFFLSKDKDLIVGKSEAICPSHDACNQMRSKHDLAAQAEFKWMRTGGQFDRYLPSSGSRMNLTAQNVDLKRPNLKAEPPAGSQITILFAESDKCRQYFEKSHLKLKNNMVVLNS